MPLKSKNAVRRIAIALAAIAAVGLAIWWFTRPKPIPVMVTEVQRGIVESSVANTRAGTVESCLRTKLSTIIGGRIEVLAVKEGDRVKKGQLLMRLWNDDIQAQERLARAALETSRKRVVEACTLADSAEREVKRQMELHRQGFISANAIDSARAAADARVASCATAKADIAQAEANVNVAHVQQARTVLIAPFDGTIAKIVGEVGEYSTPSPPGVPTPPAIDLIDESCLYVEAPMDEVDAPKIKEGQPVRISLDALPGRTFSGKVRRVAPYVTAVEKQARTVDIEAVIDQPEKTGHLLVGYSADVEVILGAHTDVLRVPTAALLEGGRVLVVGTDDILVERKLKTGLANWEYTEVVEGLAAGDRIVTSLDRAGVKAGARITIESKATK
ncbi:MAG: efflux RND transporter periplasmic adaptor subunit [Burkholderiaceae bacterium]|jgi:HlyD family secretion protein|nr:efflux RND transporter periplasmic adaptor subunit [Burkholderiaceae bacterium]MDH5209051.1 efflux RND transporter periplasmic adaptor subunit [Burkholderiaceae bacterium]